MNPHSKVPLVVLVLMNSWLCTLKCWLASSLTCSKKPSSTCGTPRQTYICLERKRRQSIRGRGAGEVHSTRLVLAVCRPFPWSSGKSTSSSSSMFDSLDLSTRALILCRYSSVCPRSSFKRSFFVSAKSFRYRRKIKVFLLSCPHLPHSPSFPSIHYYDTPLRRSL